MKRIITNEEIQIRCLEIAEELPVGAKFYGVPRGGIAPAYMISAMVAGSIVDDPINADYIVDDLIDSGRTCERYQKEYPNSTFISLFDKVEDQSWLAFPWEVSSSGNDESAEDIGVRLLQYIGEDPTREGLQKTPARFLRAWREWTRGYSMDPVKELKVEFIDGSEGYDEMVMIDPIPFDSFCEHHLAIIQGTVHLAYIPNGKIAGLSKFCRLVEVFARRLQVQERMTVQIATAIQDVLAPLGCGVVIRAEHTCMSSRGAKIQGAVTTTTTLRGVFKEKPEVRAEFLSMIKSR